MDTLMQQAQASQGILTRKVVPANNSCLFTSIDLLKEQRSTVNLESAKPMRELIATIVHSDKNTYSSAMLGKANKDYCKWIKSNDSWGGAIEISILSKYYNMEIDVVDTQSGRIDRFGEDQNYINRILVIYDGIHYDPLLLESLDPSRPTYKYIFPTSDDSILVQAQEIANEAMSSRQFTDVNQFALRCLVCQKCLTGQVEAQAHANSTGHINFGEL
jgi:ubiquitin thioesterase OTU1